VEVTSVELRLFLGNSGQVLPAAKRNTICTQRDRASHGGKASRYHLHGAVDMLIILLSHVQSL